MLKTSAVVLRSRRELATFPVLSGVVSALVAVTFGLLVVVSYEPARYVAYALVIAMYLLIAYVTIFFNAALVSQADVALRGGDPSVAAGIGVAASKWARLIPWALTTATVSYLLRAARGRVQGIERALTGAAGMAWQVVSFLVLPKLVLEDRTFVEAVQESARSLKETWGENVTGNLGLTLLKVVLAVPGLAAIWLAARLGGVAIPVLVTFGVLWLLAALVVVAALTGIYQTALYQFVAERRTPEAFASADLDHAFSS